MQFQAIKGMRDFYPAEMGVRRYIEQAWREVSLRNGFQEYDGPILEYLDLYTVKSGEEIVGQLFHLTDRGERELAIRPEMTPTLARMVNARARSLALPIKWFSMPRLCRAERPQRGRLREFFQWNIDVLGVDDPLADAETIFVAIDFFRHVGLGPAQVEMRINSRRLMMHMLLDLGFAEVALPALYSLLDRRDKMAPEKFATALAEAVPEAALREKMLAQLSAASLDELAASHGWSERTQGAITELRQIFRWLDCWGVAEYARFDLSVVRGLAYYTGCVFEAYGKGGLRRALCGGGRYDNLLETLGGPAMPGVGFATSDVVIEDLLAECGLIRSVEERMDCHVAAVGGEQVELAVQLAGALRQAGLRTLLSYRPLPVNKQLKCAAEARCRYACILGEETRQRSVVSVKDLETGRQRELELAHLLSAPRAALARE